MAEGTVAADQLRLFIERIERLEEEKKGISDDVRDVYAEAKGTGFDTKALREAMDRLKQQLGDAVILLAGTNGGKAALVAGVSGAGAGRINAGELLAHVASQTGGKGGGRPDMAQGGGEDGPALVAALTAVPVWVENRLRG